MNELIERLAREAGIHFSPAWGETWTGNKRIEAFAQAVARECAEIADQADGEKDCWLVAGRIKERFGL